MDWRMDFNLAIRDPIAPQLFTKLRQAIVEMALRPGEALSEKEIAARFGVSRQPVREAFIKLSEVGLLQVLPNRGSFVVKISVRDVANARFVREAVEVSIARSASEIATAVQIDALADQLDQQRQVAATGDHLKFARLDEAFHRAIAEIVDCEYAWRVVESARAQTDRVRFLSLPDASPMSRLIEQHGEILAGISARDPNRAEDAMRRHLREMLIALPEIAQKHPELFSDFDLPAHSRQLAPARPAA